MTRKTNLTDRVRYAFDNTLSRGTIALIGWLAVLSLLIILLAGLLINITQIRQPGEAPLSFAEAAWSALMRTLDAGTMGGDQGWGFRVIMFLVTLGGVFIISTLIGILTSGLEGKIEEMQKGRSRVIERNHTVILGWSPQIFTIISELIEANSNKKRSCIVIMGEKDKIEMQDEIRSYVKKPGNTNIVCRTGSPIEIADLEITALDEARSIIVLSPDTDDPDSEVIKVILAIVNNPNRKTGSYHIVAEIRNPRNLEVARMVGRDEVELILVSSLVSRIIAQTCRQSGLSVVYTELLDFGGDELYFKHEPALVGKTYRESLSSFEDSAVIGLADENGTVRLNPSMNTRIGPNENLILIAEDDDTIRLSTQPEKKPNKDALLPIRPSQADPEKTLILGWNWRGASIISELDQYVPTGSTVTVAALLDEELDFGKFPRGKTENQSIKWIKGDTTDRAFLDELKIPSFHHVILLCYSDSRSTQQADAATLVTLLHLRDIREKSGNTFSIVSEMLDIRNRNLADITRADDFIVSDKLISLMLAQVSENKKLNAVFADIFDPEGSEIYLRSVSEYTEPRAPVDFYMILEAAAARGETAIGYRIKSKSNDPSKAYGVVINPDKSMMIEFTPEDKIIVLAES